MDIYESKILLSTDILEVKSSKISFYLRTQALTLQKYKEVNKIRVTQYVQKEKTMEDTLAIIGIVTILVGIVIIIFKHRKKEAKTLGEIITGIGIVLFLASFFLATYMMEKERKEATKVQVKPPVEVESPEEKVEEEKAIPGVEFPVEKIKEDLKVAFNNEVEITFQQSNNSFIISPQGEMAEKIGQMSQMANDIDYVAWWDGIIQQILPISQDLNVNYGGGIQFHVLDPQKVDKPVLIITDGYLMHDELEKY